MVASRLPRPIKIRGRNFYNSQQRDIEIPEWIERQSREEAQS